MRERGGIEEEILSEEVAADTTGGHRYVRRVRFSNLPEMMIRVVWALGPDNRIAGFGVRPEQAGE